MADEGGSQKRERRKKERVAFYCLKNKLLYMKQIYGIGRPHFFLVLISHYKSRSVT